MIPGPLDPEDLDPDTLPLAHARDLVRPRERQWPRQVIGLGIVAYAVMVFFAVGTATFELVEAIPLIPILAYVSQRFAQRIAARDEDPAVVQLVLAAFAARMLGALVRVAVVAWVYNNRSDSIDYHEWGQFLAPSSDGSTSPRRRR